MSFNQICKNVYFYRRKSLQIKLLSVQVGGGNAIGLIFIYFLNQTCHFIMNNFLLKLLFAMIKMPFSRHKTFVSLFFISFISLLANYQKRKTLSSDASGFDLDYFYNCFGGNLHTNGSFLHLDVLVFSNLFLL